MVILSEIVTVIKVILAIQERRSDENDAYEILRTTLEIYLPILEQMDPVFGNEDATAPARNKLHEIVLHAQAAITKYQDRVMGFSLRDHSKEFIKLDKLFLTCTAALMLYVSFSMQQRGQINEYVNPPPPGPLPDQGGIHHLAESADPLSSPLPPVMVRAILTLKRYKYRIEEFENQA